MTLVMKTVSCLFTCVLGYRSSKHVQTFPFETVHLLVTNFITSLIKEPVLPDILLANTKKHPKKATHNSFSNFLVLNRK